MTGAGRVAAALALVAVLVMLGLREHHAARERALAAEGAARVAVEVPAAALALSSRLLALEEAGARTADRALQLTRGVSDPTELLLQIERVRLPADAGVHVEDRFGRVLAWVGLTLPDDAYDTLRRDGAATELVETPTSRRLAVRRTLAGVAGEEGHAVAAVCHLPIERRYPLRSRYLGSWSIEADIEQAFRVGDVSILAPTAPTGTILESASGGPIARLDVRPLSAASWLESIDAATARHRGAAVAVLALLAAVVVWWEIPGLLGRRGLGPSTTQFVRAGLIVAARLVLSAYPLSAVLGDGPLTDAFHYSGGLPLRLGHSAAALFLTCAAAAGVAACVRNGIRRLEPRPWGVPAFAVGFLAVTLSVRALLAALIDDLVTNSTVEFFSPERVLPYPASAALLGALLATGIACILVMEAAWRLFAPESFGAPHIRAAAAVAASIAAAPVGPLPLAGPVPSGIFSIGGFLFALSTIAFARGVAARAAVVPLGVAVALFVPLERHLAADVQAEVSSFADEYLADAAEEEKPVAADVAEVLVELAADEDLAESLRRARLPRDLAAQLWARSGLSERTAPTRLEILPTPPLGEPQTFSADAPPAGWLPDPAQFPAPEEPWTTTTTGRGLGSDSVWVIGQAPVVVDGRRLAALRVLTEVRRAAVARLMDLDPPGASTRRDQRLVAPAVSAYDAAGRLLETEDPFRAAGSQLRPETLERLRARSGSVWSRGYSIGDREFAVLLVPQTTDDDVFAGAHAFAVESPGIRALVLRGTKAALCGSVLALIALLTTATWWARGARLRLAHRLVISYVIVSAVPLLVLAFVNRELVRDRYDQRTARELRESVTVLASSLQRPGGAAEWMQAAGDEAARTRAAEALRNIAYSPGHRSNLYVGHRLWASSDQALADTLFQPPRMPGPAYREVVLGGRPFYVEEARIGGHAFMIGYAPLRAPDGEVLGAVSMPLVQQRQLRDREQAQAMAAVLGFYLASFVAAMAAGTWLARRLSAPLAALRRATRRVAGGDLSQAVPAAGPGELGEVVEAFNTMMQDLADSRQRLVRAEKEAAWRDMARQVAHEVKNPLTPMRLAAEHLRRAYHDGAANFAAVLERAVDVIIRQTASLQRIATDFADFARLPVQRREPVEVGPLARDVLDLYTGVSGLTIEFDDTDGVAPVLADPDELRRVLVNLAGNAVEALAGSPGTIRARVAQDGHYVVLTLTDDGPGIPASVLPKLYEPSFSTKTGGTGLGLAICKRAIEDLGGTIVIRSEAGRGTAVTVRLPAALAPELPQQGDGVSPRAVRP